MTQLTSRPCSRCGARHVEETRCHNLGKPNTITGVSPHSPTAVPIGATINLTLCSD
ncbi:hypothetical protein [Streptomyces sp. GQFP]|uniref:hypothetical protein n=1 Tax=Streptomyces sp. GQFP TaxID=2907545 RepID=UPI001F4164FE|nr:hypothetical protein [Streptomyces sp. GQFP]UIX31779.1 hypothetical protein LUX31_18025 [Streptomyces sp. GQFP]